jgi:dolichyl-phosphate-mannose--protein O-mannosyl transferase
MLFLAGLEHPKTLNFDEAHYIPAARTFITLDTPVNLEHPPLAKEIMSLGLRFFGDQPLGWRVMSTVAGSLSVLFIFGIGFLLTHSLWFGIGAALLTLFDQMHFVQSRIAMLDTFMECFILGGLYFYLLGKQSKRLNEWVVAWVVSSIFWGLALASKWFAVIPLLTVILYESLESVILFKTKKQRPFYFKKHFAYRLILFSLVLVFTYYLTFVPYLFFQKQAPGFLDIFYKMQKDAWVLQQNVGGHHSYQSTVWQWITYLRPMWYAFDGVVIDQKDMVRGVFLCANIVLSVAAWVALVYFVWALFLEKTGQNKSRKLPKQQHGQTPVVTFLGVTALPFLLYFTQTLSWILIPRKLTFYYYYYPSVMMFGLMVVLFLQHAFQRHSRRSYALMVGILTGILMMTFGCFVFFYPILAAHLLPKYAFLKWMLLSSWI